MNFHKGNGRGEKTFNHTDVRAILLERKGGLTFMYKVYAYLYLIFTE